MIPEPTLHLRGTITSALAVVFGLLAPSVGQAEDPCPNAEIRAQQGVTHLPDCRAYEQVSPADKNGADAQPAGLRTSGDGQGITWTSPGAYAGAMGVNALAQYAARRTPSGWQTTAYAPSKSKYPHVPPGTSSLIGALAFPADLSSMTYISGGPFDPADQDANILGNGALDVYRVDGSGTATWLSRGQGIDANASSDISLAGVSEDGSSVFMSSSQPLVPGVPTDGKVRLYRWRDGTVELAGVDENGAPLPNGSALGNGTTSSPATGGGNNGRLPDSSAVSTDGSAFVYQDRPYGAAFAAGRYAVYLHEDGVGSTEISVSQRSGSIGEPAPTGAKMVAATPDLEKIFIQSPDQLTDDAPPGGGDYVYDRASGQLQFSNPDNSVTAPLGGNVNSGLVQVSENGDYVYFTSTVVLDAGAVDGGRNLYVRNGSATTFIATLEDSDVQVTTKQLTGQRGYPALTETGLSADGTRLLFTSTASLADADTSGFMQVYLYDAQSNQVTCVSCRSSGEASEGASTLTLEGPLNASGRQYTPRAITEDGRTIVFSSEDQLVPKDGNGTWDVYMYRDGELSLLSGGKSQYASALVGMSPDGSDIYMFTRDSLVAQDVDAGAQDVYDVRVDGGIPEQSEGESSCIGDDCQEQSPAPPSLPSIGSVSFEGGGNVVPVPELATATVYVSKLRAVNGRAAKLRVRVPDAGRIAVRGSLIRKFSRSANERGGYSVKVVLKHRAKTLLLKKGTLVTNVRVWYRRMDGQVASKIIKVTFKTRNSVRAKAKKGGR